MNTVLTHMKFSKNEVNLKNNLKINHEFYVIHDYFTNEIKT